MLLYALFTAVAFLLSSVSAYDLDSADTSWHFGLRVTGDKRHTFDTAYVDNAILTINPNSKYDKEVLGDEWHSFFLKINTDHRKEGALDTNFYFKAVTPDWEMDPKLKKNVTIHWDNRKKRLCYSVKRGEKRSDDPCAVIACDGDWNGCQDSPKGMGFAVLDNQGIEAISYGKSGRPMRYLEDWQQDSEFFLRPWGIAHYIAVYQDPKDQPEGSKMDYNYFLKWYDTGMGVSVSIKRVKE